jgi:hypothetical protein
LTRERRLTLKKSWKEEQIYIGHIEKLKPTKKIKRETRRSG